jgi:uncharacterized metal-binding protein YceD (DUF177 family)
MELLNLFDLPIRSWSLGIHTEDFEINDSFFQLFDTGLVDNGSYLVSCEIEKMIDSLIVNIKYQGTTRTQCDRCLADISLPVTGMNSYLINYDETAHDDGEVIYINRDKSSWNIAPLIWDSINLGFPFVRIFNCQENEPVPCDIDVLSKLQFSEDINPNEEPDHRWDVLSGLNLDDE